MKISFALSVASDFLFLLKLLGPNLDIDFRDFSSVIVVPVISFSN